MPAGMTPPDATRPRSPMPCGPSWSPCCPPGIGTAAGGPGSIRTGRCWMRSFTCCGRAASGGWSPHDLVPWWTAYRWYRTWAADGTWDAVHDRLRGLARIAAGRDPQPSAAVLDAQSVKTSEGGQARGVDMGKKVTGRKRHLVTDTLGLVLAAAVTAASVQDRPGGRAVLARAAAAFPSLALAWADGGYANEIDDGLVRWAAQDLGLVLEIVRRSGDVKGFAVLPRRWVIERTFGWLVRNRRLARDYERLTTCSETMIKIAMIRLMAARLAGHKITWASTTEREALRRMTIEDQLAHVIT